MIDLKKSLDQWGPIEGKLLYPSFWYPAYTKGVYKLAGINWPPYIGIFDNGRMTFYFESQKMQAMGEIALKKWILPRRRLAYAWKRYKKIEQELREFHKKTEPVIHSGDFKTLALSAKRFSALLLDLWSWASVAELANFSAPAYLREKLAGRVPDEKLDEVLEAE